MFFEDLNLSMTMRLEKITISGQALGNIGILFPKLLPYLTRHGRAPWAEGAESAPQSARDPHPVAAIRTKLAQFPAHIRIIPGCRKRAVIRPLSAPGRLDTHKASPISGIKDRNYSL